MKRPLRVVVGVGGGVVRVEELSRAVRMLDMTVVDEQQSCDKTTDFCKSL